MRHSNIAKIAGDISCRDVQTPTQGDGEMGKIATNANTFAKGVKGSAIWSSLLVIELYMAMDEVAHGLNARPTRRYSSERFPGEIEELAIDFTITAWQ